MKFNDSFFNEVYSLSQKGKVDKAIKMLDSVPENHPEYSRALFYKSMIIGDDDSSYDLFEKAIETEFFNSMSSRKTEDVFELAIDCYSNDEFEQAIKLFDLCIEDDYEVVDSLGLKSACLAKMGLYEDADECIDRALSIDENNVDVLQAKSSYAGEMGKYEESLKWIDRAIRLDPDCVENYHIKALTYFKMNDYNKAFECIDKYPEDIDGLMLKVKLYNELGDYENAEKCFEIAQGIDEDNLDVLFTKTMFYFSRDDFETANECIDECLRIEPESDVFAEFKLAIVSQLNDEDLLDDALNDLYNGNSDFINSMLDSEGPMSNHQYDKYALEEYGKDYPSQSMNHDIYKVLSGLRIESDINKVYSDLVFENPLNEVMMKGVLVENDLIEAGNVEMINVKKEAENMSAQKLSEMLQQNGITASGKKKKLVKLAVKNISPEKFASNYHLTVEGEDFLEEFSWFEVYDEYMTLFELDDVSRYIDEHDGEIPEILNDYTDEHILMAHEKNDFEYLDDCLISQSLLRMHYGDYEGCLRTSLREVILKLNPVYEYEIYYALYNLFVEHIIENIRECLKITGRDIESLFNEIWDLKDSEIDFTTREVGLDYLKMALDGEDLQDLSEDYEEKYINVIYRGE